MRVEAYVRSRWWWSRGHWTDWIDSNTFGTSTLGALSDVLTLASLWARTRCRGYVGKIRTAASFIRQK